MAQPKPKSHRERFPFLLLGATRCCCCCATHRHALATPSQNAYLKLIQVSADAFAHLEESCDAGLVQQDVDGDAAERARLLKVLKDIQVCQGVGNYGNHLQWKITDAI